MFVKDAVRDPTMLQNTKRNYYHKKIKFAWRSWRNRKSSATACVAQFVPPVTDALSAILFERPASKPARAVRNDSVRVLAKQ